MSAKSISLVLLLLCGGLALAQTVNHQHPSATAMIDGAKTPNLIPDLAAWRLWLVSVTAEDTSKPELVIDRRHSFLRDAGIADDQMVIADEILANFTKDYASMIDSYNKRAQKPSIVEFNAQRDALVQATQTSLSTQLAPRSAGSLRNFIVREKAHMKVAKEVQ